MRHANRHARQQPSDLNYPALRLASTGVTIEVTIIMTTYARNTLRHNEIDRHSKHTANGNMALTSTAKSTANATPVLRSR